MSRWTKHPGHTIDVPCTELIVSFSIGFGHQSIGGAQPELVVISRRELGKAAPVPSPTGLLVRTSRASAHHSQSHAIAYIDPSRLVHFCLCSHSASRSVSHLLRPIFSTISHISPSYCYSYSCYCCFALNLVLISPQAVPVFSPLVLHSLCRLTPGSGMFRLCVCGLARQHQSGLLQQHQPPSVLCPMWP